MAYVRGELSQLFKGEASGLFGSKKRKDDARVSSSKKRKGDDSPSLATSEAAAGTTRKRQRGAASKGAHVQSKEKKDLVDEEFAQQEKNARTVFVGNVPVKAEIKLEKLKKQLRKAFSKFGQIESIRLRSVPIAKSAIASNQDYKTMLKVSAYKNNIASDQDAGPGDSSSGSSGRCCVAYVVFSSVDDVGGAIENGNGLEFHGHHLRVDSTATRTVARDKVSRDKGLFDRRRSVFVGNLRFGASEEGLRTFFEQHGLVVESVRIVRDKVTHEGKGFGYVLFGAPEIAAEALELNEKTFCDRPLRITKCAKSNSEKEGKSVVKNHQGTSASFNPGSLRRRLRTTGKTKSQAAKQKKKKQRKKN